ncbi:hypothetical protein [Streptomyces sp. NPDC004250]|uniref:hypothetical protein n=1 Tax=Streptomyces sp. NPDC004250 TaxID=3364692 RepID=UPI0036AF4BF2
MTSRHTVDSITSDALDALYEQLDAAEAGEAQRQLATAREALASATTRAARAEAALEQVRALRERARTEAPASQGPTWEGLDLALDGNLPPVPAATGATDTEADARP